MSIFPAPMCLWCKHYRKDELACSAFPERIPDAILESRHDHRKAFAKDKGIRFELKTGAEEEEALAALGV